MRTWQWALLGPHDGHCWVLKMPIVNSRHDRPDKGTYVCWHFNIRALAGAHRCVGRYTYVRDYCEHMNTSCIWPLRTSTTLKSRPRVRRQTASVNASTGLCRTTIPIMPKGRTPENTVLEKLPCHFPWRHWGGQGDSQSQDAEKYNLMNRLWLHHVVWVRIVTYLRSKHWTLFCPIV